jgi:hypothetical protein
MAFRLPEFNIECEIYRGPWLTKTLASAHQPCNLAYGKRIAVTSSDTFFQDQYSVLMQLLLPPLVDIRDLSCAAVSDVVEVPAGSGRWYQVCNVDDIGKGFDNEHRCALLFKIAATMFGSSYAGLSWPAPIP